MSALPRRLPGLMEAVSLLALAGFLVYLLTAGNYWMYLNPRFQSLSWACAVALGGLGLYSLVRPPAGATWPRAGLYLAVVALCLLSELGVERWLAKAGVESGALKPEEAVLPSRAEMGGRQYLRINLGELYDLATARSPQAAGMDLAVRGFVRRSPEGDARGEFVLYRVALYCCYADSTAVGFRVRPPQGADMPENGSWQVVYGTLAPSKDDSQAALTSIGGSSFATVHKEYALQARLLEAQKAPGMGMMYEFRSQEPYAY